MQILHSVGKRSLTAQSEVWLHLLWPSISIFHIITKISTFSQLREASTHPRAFSERLPSDPTTSPRVKWAWPKKSCSVRKRKNMQVNYKHKQNHITITKADTSHTARWQETKLTLCLISAECSLMGPNHFKYLHVPHWQIMASTSSLSSHWPSHLPHSAPLPLSS